MRTLSRPLPALLILVGISAALLHKSRMGFIS